MKPYLSMERILIWKHTSSKSIFWIHIPWSGAGWSCPPMRHSGACTTSSKPWPISWAGPYGGYHLYEFDLSTENTSVTNDEESFEEYQYYKQNKKQYEERLRLAPLGSFERSDLERLMKTVVRQPSRIKIDNYLEKYKRNPLFVRFWRRMGVSDHAGTDCGWLSLWLPDIARWCRIDSAWRCRWLGWFRGVPENLPRSITHPNMRNWKNGPTLKSSGVRPPDWINNSLKYLNYKKTEWDQINHDNYFIIEDKYRKNWTLKRPVAAHWSFFADLPPMKSGLVEGKICALGTSTPMSECWPEQVACWLDVLRRSWRSLEVMIFVNVILRWDFRLIERDKNSDFDVWNSHYHRLNAVSVCYTLLEVWVK